jgi:HD superfamily phosphohydrolase
MKRIFIAVFLIFLSIFIGCYSLNKTETICNKMITEINKATEENIEVTESSSHQKRINFYKTTTELKSLWEKESEFFYYFFNNDDLKTLETNIEKLPEHAKNGDFESAYLCLAECLEELEYLKNNTKLSFSNIF